MTIIAYQKKLRDRLVRHSDDISLVVFRRLLDAIENARTRGDLKNIERKLKRTTATPA